ncbi:MAG: holo-ACP synthase [Bacilli bacterium]|nr:holo-ACP synthase [Bacilli bacterium]
MIKGIGIDIVEIARIERLMKKNERFVKRILGEKERDEFERLKNNRRKIEYVAGRFAAKEAFSKAIGTGIGEIHFAHIQVLHEANGKPYLTAKGFDDKKLFVSISHSDSYAVAQVIVTD